MTQKKQQPEPDKSTRIEKHHKKKDGKRHVVNEDHMNHIHLKPNERNHNYTYLKHIEDYVEDDGQED